MPIKIITVPIILQMVIFSPRKSQEDKNNIIRKMPLEIGKARVKSFFEIIINQIKAPNTAIKAPM